MKYMLSLFGDETLTSNETTDNDLRAHDDFAAYAETRGVTILDGAELDVSRGARTLRRSGSDIVVSDGPFAASNEQVGGYYIIEAPSFDEALDVARACPRYAGTELRPVWEISS